MKWLFWGIAFFVYWSIRDPVHHYGLPFWQYVLVMAVILGPIIGLGGMFERKKEEKEQKERDIEAEKIIDEIEKNDK